MKVVLFSTIALATGTALPSVALDNFYASLDKNHDGMISLKEAVAEPALLASFGDIDKNRDGKITQYELANSQLAKKLVTN